MGNPSGAPVRPPPAPLPGSCPAAVRRCGPSLLLSLALLAACSSPRPDNLGILQGRLAPCPASPNCVSSDASGEQGVAPFGLAVDPGRAWHAARGAVAALPRTRIVSHTPDYLHAECTSAVFGFVDDLELNLRPGAGIIAVRSASRIGYSDLGVNRRRVETLREALSAQGVTRSPASTPAHP